MLKAWWCAAFAVLGCQLSATAQEWPTRPVRIVVPFAAGSTPDIVMRLIRDRLHATSKLSVVVENRPGASGNTGTDAVAKAAPDGSTIGVSILGPLGLNTLLFNRMPYDPFKDLALVTRLTDMPSVLAVNADVPAKTTAELVVLLRSQPGNFNFGSIGNGSLSHLAMVAMAIASGTQMVHIAYPSSPQAVTALIRGDVQMVCLPAAAVVPQAQTGKIRMLAVTTADRAASLPEVPTLHEGGIAVEANAWNGLIAPAGTPPALVEAISRGVNKALRDPDIRAKLGAQFMAPAGTTPAAFAAFRDAEMKRWAPVVKAAGLIPQ